MPWAKKVGRLYATDSSKALAVVLSLEAERRGKDGVRGDGESYEEGRI